MSCRIYLIGFFFVLSTLILPAKQTCKSDTGICFLDTSLTYYVVEVPDPMCVNGVECHSIFKIRLLRDETLIDFPYRVVGTRVDNNMKINDLGYLRQDLELKKIVWKRPGGEVVDLQDVGGQMQSILSRKIDKRKGEYSAISKVLSKKCITDNIEIDQYFNFIVRMFSYDTEHKDVVVNGKKTGIVVETIGASSYDLLAIELDDHFVYKSQYFNLYRERVEKN